MPAGVETDLLRYPVITAAAVAAVTPEQAGIWAYPQPGLGPEQNAFTLCGALLGRIHLSGHIDQMTPGQQALVAEAVGVYKAIRADLAGAVPFWPLGLPRWADSWVALGLRTGDRNYLLVWRRGRHRPAGPPAASCPPGRGVPGDPAEASLPVPHLGRAAATAEVLFPGRARAQSRWEPARGELIVTLPGAPAACLIRLTPG